MWYKSMSAINTVFMDDIGTAIASLQVELFEAQGRHWRPVIEIINTL